MRVKAIYVSVWQGSDGIRTLKMPCIADMYSHRITDPKDPEMSRGKPEYFTDEATTDYILLDSDENGLSGGVGYKVYPHHVWRGLEEDERKQSFWYGAEW